MWNFTSREEAKMVAELYKEVFGLLDKGENIVYNSLVGVKNADYHTIVNEFVEKARREYEKGGDFEEIKSLLRVATKIELISPMLNLKNRKELGFFD